MTSLSQQTAVPRFCVPLWVISRSHQVHLQPSLGGTELPQGTKSVREGPHGATFTVTGSTRHGATLNLSHPALGCSHLFTEHPGSHQEPGWTQGPSLGSLATHFPLHSIPSTRAKSAHVAIPIKPNCLAQGPGSAAFISLPGRGLCKLSPRLTD